MVYLFFEVQGENTFKFITLSRELANKKANMKQ